MISDTIRLLNDNGLRKTDCRLDVLDFLLSQEHAVTHGQLEAEFPDFDRVTLYRTLSTFEDKGIIHDVKDGSGATKYAVCKHGSCSEHGHDDEHVHFKCIKCEQVSCVDNVHIPHIPLPEGFRAKSKNLLVEGLCNNC